MTMRIIRRIYRWITGPQRRRREQQAYDQLIIDMRNTWTVVEGSLTRCFRDVNDDGSFLGNIHIVKEVNELNERRVRCIECPDGFIAQQSRKWSDYQYWAMKAAPTKPPRKPMEIRL